MKYALLTTSNIKFVSAARAKLWDRRHIQGPKDEALMSLFQRCGLYSDTVIEDIKSEINGDDLDESSPVTTTFVDDLIEKAKALVKKGGGNAASS